MDLIDKTSLPKKIPLSGSDCFHLVLDKHAKKHNAGDNVMRIVFYFDSTLSGAKTAAILKKSAVVYWLCNIKLKTGFFLKKPFWQYEDNGRDIILTEHTHPIENEIPPAVLNRDIPINALRFVECDIVHYPSDHSVLIISWNHILMDGRGISMLVQHLNDIDKKIPHQIERLFPVEAKKNNIIRHIKNMYEVKKFIQTSSQTPISSVASKNSTSSQHFNNRIIFFNKAATEQIETTAFKNGARFGANLFYLACCAQVVNNLNLQKNKKGVIWTPIPYDGRLKGSFGPVISNFVAYLFYRLTQEELSGIQQTILSLNKQMAQQLKNQMPRKYNMLLTMMRHIPLWLYYFLINRTGEGSFASFLYSSTGNNFNSMNHLFDEPVKKMTIFPSSTFPPGLTFSFLKHDDQLNINIAYSSDIISNIDLDFIETELKNLLASKV